jgi:cathepsin D
MIVSPNDATTLHSSISGAVSDNQGNFAIPCDTEDEINMVLGGNSFPISPKDYVGSPLPPSSGATNLCQSNIAGQQVGGPDQWLVGDVFLKNVYTVFDYDNNQLGFGAKSAANSKSASTSTGNNQQMVSSSDAGRSTGSARMTLIYGMGSIFLSMILFF